MVGEAENQKMEIQLGMPAHAQPVPLTSMQEFLEKLPPGSSAHLELSLEWRHIGVSQYGTPKLPPVELYCSAETCEGRRFFDPLKLGDVNIGTTNTYWRYYCRNCHGSMRTFAVRVHTKAVGDQASSCLKVGEDPPFGPHTPARLISLFGPDREYFLKGRRAESQNMGIAAFAYYRRVIENQKDRIFDAILSVAERLKSDPAMIADLKLAKRETQFSSGVERIKHGIPPALLINGHNPLTLVHSSLSEGLHALTDEDCLSLATSIRVLMAELAERLGQAMKDEAELTAALGRLLNPPPTARAGTNLLKGAGRGGGELSPKD